MNEFSSTENSGLLKDYYPTSDLQKTLKKKREKLADTKLGETDKEEKDDSER